MTRAFARVARRYTIPITEIIVLSDYLKKGQKHRPFFFFNIGGFNTSMQLIKKTLIFFRGPLLLLKFVALA